MEKTTVIEDARSAVDRLDKDWFRATADALREVNKLIEQADLDHLPSKVGEKASG